MGETIDLPKRVRGTGEGVPGFKNGENDTTSSHFLESHAYWGEDERMECMQEREGYPAKWEVWCVVVGGGW